MTGNVRNRGLWQVCTHDTEATLIGGHVRKYWALLEDS